MLKVACAIVHVFWCVAPIVLGRDQCDSDTGFALLFTTNLHEFNDVPMTFEKAVPHWIKGTLVRNGLGRFELGKHKFEHSFDAYSKLCSWTFHGNGSVSFTSRFLQSDSYKASVKLNDIAPYLLFEGVIPDFDELEKLEALARGIDNMNVNVIAIYDNDVNHTDYIAVNDFWKVYTLDPLNLTTFGPVTADVPEPKKHISKDYAFLNFLSTAHPLPEPETRNHLTFLSSVSLIPWIKSTISLVRIKSVRDRELVARWTVDKVPYMHSFSVTRNYAIIFASPFYVDTVKMLKYAKPFKSLDWYPDVNTTVYVVHLKTGKLTSLKTANMFTMHHVNAFEADDGGIVVDVSSYPSPKFVAELQMAILLDPVKRNAFNPSATLKRYKIDLTTQRITLSYFTPSSLTPYTNNLDMPVINEKYRSVHYCYVYGVVLNYNNVSLTDIALVKKNVCGDSSQDASWALDGHYPVEPWFVASPGAVHEDDGYLLVPIVNGYNSSSYLAVIDARTMHIVNNATLPTIIPYSLHGRFFADVS